MPPSSVSRGMLIGPKKRVSINRPEKAIRATARCRLVSTGLTLWPEGVREGKQAMRQSIRTGAAVIVALTTALSLEGFPVAAQNAGDYAQVCRNINGRLACSSVARPSIGSGSTRPYEQWEDGSPARGSAAGYSPRAIDPYQFPQSFSARSNLGGFGR